MKCPSCDGQGHIKVTRTGSMRKMPCDDCDGKGEIPDTINDPASEKVSNRMQGVDCPDCEDGTKHKHQKPDDYTDESDHRLAGPKL